MEFKCKKYSQLIWFATEVLYLVDEGQTVSVTKVCEEIENGAIVEFIKHTFGLKNNNTKSNPELTNNVSDIFKQLYVSEREAEKYGVNNNGLVYIIHLIFEQLNQVMLSMSTNGIDPDKGWSHLE